jgi:hypothetical protein
LGDKFRVISVRDLTTGYDSTQPDGRAILPTDPKTHMITFQVKTRPNLNYYFWLPFIALFLFKKGSRFSYYEPIFFGKQFSQKSWGFENTKTKFYYFS